MRALHLGSRRGDSYITLMIVLLPVMLIMMAAGIDGLALAASYNRAVGLARTAAQAGATAIDFDGARVSLSAQACAIAAGNVCDNAGGCGGSVSATCTQSSDALEVTVSLKPIRIFGSAIGPNAEFVIARARSSPRYGINEAE